MNIQFVRIYKLGLKLQFLARSNLRNIFFYIQDLKHKQPEGFKVSTVEGPTVTFRTTTRLLQIAYEGDF